MKVQFFVILYCGLICESQGVINPCGLVAHSYFNDSFSLITSEDREGNELGLQLKVKYLVLCFG